MSGGSYNYLGLICYDDLAELLGKEAYRGETETRP